MLYHKTEQEARAAGDAFVQGLAPDMQGAFMHYPSFEPFNGWVCVLRPTKAEAFGVALGLLLDRFEVDLSGWALRRLRNRPAYHVGPPAMAPKPGKAPAEPEPVATWKPGDKKPW